MTARHRTPILMLIVFVALMATPGWMMPGLVAAGLAFMGLRAIHERSAGRSRRDTRGEAIRLGSDERGRSIEIAAGELSAHGLILGASGTGKTTTLLRILDEQIAAGRPVVAIDMKGSPAFAAVLAEASAAAGRRLKLWTVDGAARWNPLQYGNPTELKDKLIATERFTEPHYQRAAERYMQIVFRVLQAAHPGRPPTLEEAVTNMDPGRLPILLRDVPPDLAERVHDYLADLTPDQHSAIRGVQTRLALITESAAGEFLTPGAPHDTIDLRRALAGDEVVLFSLNSSTYGQLASQVGTLVVQDLVSALGHQLSRPGSPRQPATVAIDEFSGLGGDHVVNLFARVREAGGAVLVATQEMADLDRAASGLRDQVVGNTAFKIIHRQDVPASARLVAQMGGTERVWVQTRSLGTGLLGGRPSSRGTRHEVDRFILDPNRIMTLRTGEAAIISKLRGARPTVVRISREGRRAPER